MVRRTLLTVAGWLAAAVVATLVGLAAVRVIGAGITGGAAGEVLTREEIARRLDSATPSATAAPAPPTPAPSASSAARAALSTPGGTVVATCADGLVTLLSWAPAQGFAVTDVERGPRERAELKFRGSNGKIEVKVVCAAGQPSATWKRDD
ncbi:septum formation initiator [Micromonospora sp. NPDC049679]|uniref:septum formation initiator n=1 Tax=Micromonospora sp. NPDC049679 TaxID=3155920 RepID=UPI0033EEB94A